MSSDAETPSRPVLPSERTETVSLREFEQRLFTFQKFMDERTRYEREILDSRSEALDKALQLQAREYERRLFELNHAHEIAIENWRHSLPREVFESYMTEFMKWRDGVNTSLTAREGQATEIISLERRVGTVESSLQQAFGALTLIRFMGFAGVIALIVTFLRIMKMVP